MHPVIARITMRQLLGRRRTALLLLLSAILLLIAIVYRLGSPNETEALDVAARLLNLYGVATMLPLVALILGTGALGADIDDGTAVYLLAKPIPRATIVITKLAVAWALTVLLAVVPMVIAGAIAAGGTGGGLVAGIAVGGTVGALAYCALFIALSVVTSRAFIIGLAYVLIWEGFLAGLFAGTRTFSIRQHTLALTDAIAEVRGDALGTPIETSTAVVVAVIVVVVALAVAIRRLGDFEIRGETA